MGPGGGEMSVNRCGECFWYESQYYPRFQSEPPEWRERCVCTGEFVSQNDKPCENSVDPATEPPQNLRD